MLGLTLNERRDYITEALKRLPTYATTLGRWSIRTPIHVNVFQRAARGRWWRPCPTWSFQPASVGASLITCAGLSRERDHQDQSP